MYLWRQSNATYGFLVSPEATNDIQNAKELDIQNHYILTFFKQKGHVATFNTNLYKVTSDLHII